MKVSLISMPFGSLERPSIALGLLKSLLRENGISATVLYANHWYAEKIGLRNYNFFSNFSSELLTGEWVFSQKAFPGFEVDSTPYLNYCQTVHIKESVLQRARREASPFIDELAEKILEDNPGIVGCSSVFQQHCACLAVLRRIKELEPGIVTVMGGANCEGIMGEITHRNFDWLDYVVSGEADIIFPELCKTIIENNGDTAFTTLPDGVLGPPHRGKTFETIKVGSARVENLEILPAPDYDEYFETLEKSPFNKQILPGLLIEASRGCWWGQKKPCSFCSLTGETNTYRSKSGKRTLDELAYLSKTYNIKKIELVDNIFSMKYFDTLLPALARLDEKYTVLVETKSNLKEKHLQLLSEAGVRWIQTGIESLHDEILAILNKGNKSWINIQLLKWGMQYGIYIIWNFLVNVPGEKDEWYDDMVEWLPLIQHLQPPTGTTAIRFDRFSEFYKNSGKHGLTMSPYWTYSYVYPLPIGEIEKFAYYFVDTTPVAGERTGLAKFTECIKQWQDQFYSSRDDIIQKKISKDRTLLALTESDSKLEIRDTRSCALQTEIILEGLAGLVYKACDSAKTLEMLLNFLKNKVAETVSRADIQSVLDRGV
ncbi:MAG: RiPP maturation radical SAM protein 1 [bacterium]|nr:RiPP maturation radical SAM protein 1 [bacterium]